MAQKKKPRGKPFTKGDPRANKNGQRNKGAVALARSIRDLLVLVGEEALSVKLDNGQIAKKKNVEWLSRKIWSLALSGNIQVINTLLDRIEGKVPQAVTGPDGGPIDHAVNVKVTFVDTKG